MFSQFFGSYLLEEDLITKEQLLEVLEVEDETRLKMGVLAVNLGFMEPEAIEEIKEQQKTEDKKFGEIAVELGYLTEEQVEEILSTQKKEHLIMGQTLVDKEIMTLKELEAAFEDYKQKNQLTDEEFLALKNNEVAEIVDAFLDFETAVDSSFYQDYLVLLLNNIIRFISCRVRIKGLERKKEIIGSWGAYQQIKGDKKLFTAVLTGEEEFVEFAELFSGAELEGPKGLAQDSAAEFMNRQNGIFLVNSSEKGLKLEMDPQQAIEDFKLEFSKPAYVISLEFEFNEIKFILASERPTIN